MNKLILSSFGNTAYRHKGSGIPVVLLHGFCEDSTMWASFVENFPEEGYQWILVDFPGFGESELLADADIESMAQIVIGLVNGLGLGQVILIGHSMGGYVALEFARNHPEKLLGLGLFHSHPYADSEEKKDARLKSKAFIERHGSGPYVEQLIPTLFATDFATANKSTIDQLIAKAKKYPPEAITNALLAMRNRADRSEVLKALHCPVLFIIGDQDGAIPHELSMAQTVLAPTAMIHVLTGVGHMGMLEAQEKTQEILGAFIALCMSQ